MFDEWAAVAHHLDEVNHESELRERQLMRERQLQYREELEDQRREIAERMRQGHSAVSEKDKEAAKKQQNLLREAAERDAAKEQEKRAQAVTIMGENLRNKQRAVEETRTVERREVAVMNEELRRTEVEEHEREEYEKANRCKIANALKQSYNVQEGIRRQQLAKQKNLDRAYNEMYGQKLSEDDKQRQKALLPSMCNP